MTAELLRLAERCEKETAGSRELDVAICLATAVICNSVTPSRVRNLRADPDDRDWVLYEYDGDECTDQVREFTSSLDAAMSLVPDGYQWTIEPDGCWIRWMAGDEVREVHSFLMRRDGKCTPQAIVAACLKARALASRDDVRGE